MTDLNQLQTQSLSHVAGLSDLNDLEETRVKLLGKSGEITSLLQKIGQLPPEERKTFGQEVNVVKNAVQNALESKKTELEAAALNAKLASEKADVTLPPLPMAEGKLHPISAVIEELGDIMRRLGYSHATGPELETDFYNFTALNIPPEHPARQDHDTFYLEKAEGDDETSPILMRTQTSNAQIHTMQSVEPPFRMISLGRVYRCDSDMTHTPQFHQMEGMAIDKNIHFGHLKGTLQRFLEDFFEKKIEMRLRPAYFPFVEPGAEVDIRWDYIDARGEKKSRWLELLGSGMVHRNVLKSGGIDPEKWQGFAFGAGVERLCMVKYGINDLRMFFESHAQFLKHFGKNPAFRRN